MGGASKSGPEERAASRNFMYKTTWLWVQNHRDLTTKPRSSDRNSTTDPKHHDWTEVKEEHFSNEDTKQSAQQDILQEMIRKLLPDQLMFSCNWRRERTKNKRRKKEGEEDGKVGE